jgi:hypothetical protein
MAYFIAIFEWTLKMANFIDSHPIPLKKGQIPLELIKLDVKVARNSIIEI